MTASSSTHDVRCITPSGFHRLGYREWGGRDASRVLVCVHGLTRSARDFDLVAQEMVRHGYRVVCPDLPGRGASGWLRDPAEYALPVYVSDMVTLLARLDVGTVHWLGTSLGGLIGMSLASFPDSPVSRLVLNDVGPILPAASLGRIGSYVGKAPAFATMEEAEDYVRAVSEPFGPHSDTQWRFLTEHVVRRQADGSLRMHYDPAIGRAFNAPFLRADIELWPLYDAVRCPTLVLRGARSDLLTRETARQMTERGPRARVAEFVGVGHAPTLLHADQIAAVRDFLLEQ